MNACAMNCETREVGASLCVFRSVRSFGFCNGILQTLQFVRRHVSVAQKCQKQPFPRIAEESMKHVVDFRPAGFVLSDTGLIKKGASSCRCST